MAQDDENKPQGDDNGDAQQDGGNPQNDAGRSGDDGKQSGNGKSRNAAASKADDSRIREARLTSTGGEEGLRRGLEAINRDLGLDCRIVRFRTPHRLPDGSWDRRFQLPVLVTRYGEIDYEHGLPLRRMFDVRYVRAQVLHDNYRSHTRLAIRRDPGVDGRRVRIDYVYWVPTIAEAERAGLIAGECESDTMPYLVAVAERRSGLLFPMAVGTKLVIDTDPDRDDDGDGGDAEKASSARPGELLVDITVRRIEPYRREERKKDIYDEYLDEDKPFDEKAVLRLLERDSRALREAILARGDARHRVAMRTALALRADNRDGDDD